MEKTSNSILNTVLEDFGLLSDTISLSPVSEGLINNTWKVDINGQSYILQRVNNNVFKNPEDIASNLELISSWLKKNKTKYFFTEPLQSLSGKTLMHYEGEGYFRAFPFVNNSHTYAVVKTADQAYEAAKQFGRFTAVLKSFDSSKLKITIPHFHNLLLRYQQFSEAEKKATAERLTQSHEVIQKCKAFNYIAKEYEQIKLNPAFKTRVTHHDTKISNVLFDENNKGICVIDLDTVMPGFFISDVGDMMRTYLCPVSEEETDLGKIIIRKDFYAAVVKGYAEEMKNELTETEKKYFFYSGTFIIYMQALRFLTDYLNNDVYYGSKYPSHNLNRAKNQIALLEQLLANKSELENSIL